MRRRNSTRVRLYSDVCFSKSASTWHNSPVRLGHIEPIDTVRYVPLRPRRKCQKSWELHRRSGSLQISPSCCSYYQISALTPSRVSSKKDRAVTEQLFWLPMSQMGLGRSLIPAVGSSSPSTSLPDAGFSPR